MRRARRTRRGYVGGRRGTADRSGRRVCNLDGLTDDEMPDGKRSYGVDVQESKEAGDVRQRRAAAAERPCQRTLGVVRMLRQATREMTVCPAVTRNPCRPLPTRTISASPCCHRVTSRDAYTYGNHVLTFVQ